MNKTPEEEANGIKHSIRMELMNSDTDCGEEILVSILEQKLAIICVDKIMETVEIIRFEDEFYYNDEIRYWQEVKRILESK